MPPKTSLIKQLAAQMPHNGSWGIWMDEIKEANDRTVAIVTEAFLGEYLKQLIETFVVDSPSKRRITSDFANSINMAFMLGLINREVYEDLESIREIRNAAAHLLPSISFEMPLIKNYCLAFHTPKAAIPALIPNPPGRELFIMTTLILSSYLIQKNMIVSQEKRQTPNDMDLIAYKIVSKDKA